MIRRALLLLAFLAAPAFAQGYTTKPASPDGIGKVYMGREIAHVMGHQAADWLERPERDKEEGTSKLVPLLGITVTLGMLAAIVAALTPDEKWDARHNPQQPSRASGWVAVLAAVAGLFLGATVLLSLVAFAGQRFFEWQVEQQAQPTAAAAHQDPR